MEPKDIDYYCQAFPEGYNKRRDVLPELLNHTVYE